MSVCPNMVKLPILGTQIWLYEKPTFNISTLQTNYLTSAQITYKYCHSTKTMTHTITELFYHLTLHPINRNERNFGLHSVNTISILFFKKHTYPITKAIWKCSFLGSFECYMQQRTPNADLHTRSPDYFLIKHETCFNNYQDVTKAKAMVNAFSKTCYCQCQRQIFYGDQSTWNTGKYPPITFILYIQSLWNCKNSLNPKPENPLSKSNNGFIYPWKNSPDVWPTTICRFQYYREIPKTAEMFCLNRCISSKLNSGFVPVSHVS